MEMGENWQVNAPWAQIVASTKMPDELFKTTLELSDKIYEDANRDSAGGSLAGQIHHEYFITQEKLIETGLMKYFIEMTAKYWGTVLKMVICGNIVIKNLNTGHTDLTMPVRL